MSKKKVEKVEVETKEVPIGDILKKEVVSALSDLPVKQDKKGNKLELTDFEIMEHVLAGIQENEEIPKERKEYYGSVGGRELVSAVINLNKPKPKSKK